MSVTVEYKSANLSPEQDRWCEKYEADTEQGQVRVESFLPNGDAVAHLHKGTDEPHVVVLPRDGGEPQDREV